MFGWCVIRSREPLSGAGGVITLGSRLARAEDILSLLPQLPQADGSFLNRPPSLSRCDLQYSHNMGSSDGWISRLSACCEPVTGSDHSDLIINWFTYRDVETVRTDLEGKRLLSSRPVRIVE